MSRASSNKWVRAGANVLLLLVAPVAHVLIYALLSGFAVLGLGSLDLNPMMEPYGYITKIAANAVAAFVVSYLVFYFPDSCASLASGARLTGAGRST
jgi:hypothetical protein